jgi:HSP20 family protein
MTRQESKGRSVAPVARRFPDWPFIRFPELWTSLAEEDALRIEEYREDGTLVIRADLPGIDPDKDVDIEVVDGELRVTAQRRREERIEEKDYVRTELRYGSFARTLPLPAGASEQDVAASYKDGVLEIRVPIAEPEAAQAKKIVINRG